MYNLMKSKEVKIIDIVWKSFQTDCLSCAIQNWSVEPQWWPIIETKYFGAHQDYEIPIAWFVILASKRHFKGIDELTSDEQIDFIKTLSKIRKAMRKSLNIDVVYLIQLEDTSHHFHFWIFPRYNWMREKFWNKIVSVKPIIEYAKEFLKTEENINEVIEKASILREYLKNN